jgi:hypothetical protein
LAVLKAVGNWLIAPDDATAAAVMALRLPFVHGVITYVGNRHTAGRLVMHSHSVRACGAKSDRRCVDAETQRFLTALEVRRSQLRELYAIEECMHAIDSQLLPYMHCLVEVAAKEEERSAATRNLQKVHEECVGLEAMHARLRALVSDKERLCDDLRQQQAVSRKAASVRPEPPHLQQSLVERRDELQAYLVSVEAKIASINQQLRQCVHVDIPNHQIELQQALDDAQALSNDARAVSAEVLEVERGLLLLLSDKAQVQSDLSQLTVAAEAEESYGEVRPGQAGDLARLQRRIDEARVELSELAASLADEYSVDVTEVLSHCDGPSSNHSQRTSLSAASLPEQTSMLLDALCEEQRRQLRVALQPLTHMTSAMPVTTITTSKATATTDTAAPRISPSSSSCSLGPAPLVLTESDLDASGLEACLAELDAEGHMRGLGITDCLRVFLSALQRRHQEGGYRRGGSDSSDRNTDRSGTLNATTNRTVTPCSGATQAKNLHRSSRRPGAASTPTVVNTHSSGNPDTSIIADAINGTVYFNERDARRLMDEWCDAHMRDEADADSDAEVEGTLGRGGGDCSSRFGSSSKMMELLEAQLAALRERHDQVRIGVCGDMDTHAPYTRTIVYVFICVYPIMCRSLPRWLLYGTTWCMQMPSSPGCTRTPIWRCGGAVPGTSRPWCHIRPSTSSRWDNDQKKDSGSWYLLRAPAVLAVKIVVLLLVVFIALAMVLCIAVCRSCRGVNVVCWAWPSYSHAPPPEPPPPLTLLQLVVVVVVVVVQIALLLVAVLSLGLRPPFNALYTCWTRWMRLSTRSTREH